VRYFGARAVASVSESKERERALCCELQPQEGQLMCRCYAVWCCTIKGTIFGCPNDTCGYDRHGSGEDDMLRYFMICTYEIVGSYNQNEIGQACIAYGEEESCIQDRGGETKDIEFRMILKWIFKN
jgi:hypothetical protein